mgnify:CR=1 FL=1
MAAYKLTGTNLWPADGSKLPPGGNRGGQLPLGMVGEDEVARVSKIRGGAELRQHLAELGFVEGAEVKVISRVNGDCIVSVKGARLALNRTMSSHVMVTL